MFIALSISAAVVALLLFGFWTVGARSQQPGRMPNIEQPDRPYTSVTFDSSGSTIEGWLIYPADEAAGDTAFERATGPGLRPLIIVAHGWASNRSRVLRYSKPLLNAGFAVLVFDARSHGDSGGIKAPSVLMFRDDVIAAAAAARSMPGIDPKRIAVLGHSLGGFGAVLALARGLSVKAVVTDSMPTRFETMLKAQLKRKKLPYFPFGYLIPVIWLLRAGISRNEYRASQIPIALAANKAGPRVPILMIHALGDTYIPADDLRILAKECNSIETLFVEGNGHSMSEQDPAFWRRTIPFLLENLR